MQKALFLATTIIIGLFSTIVNAQGLGDLIDSLGSEITFGYTSTQKISIKEISDDKAIIETPLIKNQSNEAITKYTLMYSQFPLTDILDDTTLLSQSKEKTVDITTNQDPFTIELGIADGLDINTKYYIFVIPKNASGSLGEVSNEMWFNISEKTYGNAGSSETYTAVHEAAGADMQLANITHTINGNTMTLSWLSVNGSNEIDISVMTPDGSSFNRVATVKMTDQKYDFIVNRNGEYIFQFTPDNGGRQVNYTAQMNTITSTITPNNPNTPTNPAVIQTVPKTGPKENAIIIIIAAFLGYLIYKKIYKKAKA